ncbi:hypothetical protein DB88DRAFT_57183 [Papiliotrema laurentii]|uniref:Ubiquitin-like domain-containing protein n=1 Tax=Papiliotrema laurentii TaxID=5418 RepID=A0AAD9L957_PAPLA|nr:hypothetical protein DB88DRAFT_57183 [Papiliotrema laurentii]
MKLTIIGPENIYEQEVNPSMEVQDVTALIAAEAELDQDSILLSTDSGQPLSDANKTLESHGLTTDSTLFLTLTNQASSSSSGGHSAPAAFPSSDDDLERMRLQALGNPQLMEELRQRDPEMAEAVRSGTKFREEFMKQQIRLRQAQSQKDRMIEALNADPYDIEAQKKIEEAIRMEAVMENMQHAMEYSRSATSSCCISTWKSTVIPSKRLSTRAPRPLSLRLKLQSAAASCVCWTRVSREWQKESERPESWDESIRPKSSLATSICHAHFRCLKGGPWISYSDSTC